jgi:hypothetical protein
MRNLLQFIIHQSSHHRPQYRLKCYQCCNERHKTWRLFRISCDKNRAAAIMVYFGVAKSLEVTYIDSVNDQLYLRYISCFEWLVAHRIITF